MKSLYCDVILFNGWGILWRGVICLRNKVFAAYQFIVSPVDLPKLGPCPLTGVACSLANKGLVLWDLCCVYTTIHSPVSCVGQRLKPGQCLSLETCGTAFTNLGWIQTKMYPTHEFSGVQRLFFTYLHLEAPDTKMLTETVTFFPGLNFTKPIQKPYFPKTIKRLLLWDQIFWVLRATNDHKKSKTRTEGKNWPYRLYYLFTGYISQLYSQIYLAI